MKTLSFGYSVPKELLKEILLNHKNICTRERILPFGLKWKGFDP